MKTRQAYYRTKFENQANYAVDDVPLTAVCAGIEYFYAHFEEKSYRYDYSLVYVLKGKLDYMINGKALSVGQGCFALIEPKHYLIFTSSEETNSYYWLQFSGYNAKKLITDLKLEFEKSYDIGIHEEVKTCFKRIHKEFLLNDDFFDISSAACLTELLTLLSRKSIVSEKVPLISAEYINKHYNENIDIAFLASLEKMSPSHFRTVFKQSIGVSPYEYIINLRINTACLHLSSNNYSIYEIAEIVGYADQFYFSRIFKKKMGVSPLKYRQKYRK